MYQPPFVGPQGFWGSGEKGYLFSGSWGALLIILGELGSKHILWGFREHCQKVKKKYQASILSDSLKCRWLLGAVTPRPPYINVISFQFHYISFQQKNYGAFFLKNKYQASILSDSLKCRWLLGAVASTPPYINVILSDSLKCLWPLGLLPPDPHISM